MDITLIGADLEENLGVGMIAASLQRRGFAVRIVPFDATEDLERVVKATLATSPDVVGLSIQFQHRTHDFLSLARALRAAGHRGHVTCGGQLPTMAFREVLAGHGIDSVVLHEGEQTITELCDALATGAPLADVPGLALPGAGGLVRRTTPRALTNDLDALPFAFRYRRHAKHLGVPFIPLMGGRGCWGACTYCSITSFYRDARENGGGMLLRHRSPRNVAAEMAMLWHAAGGGIFCFHDDNFLLPRPADTLARVRAIREALDEFSVGKAGIIGKCRPDCVTPELLVQLRALGVLRLYIGVENASQQGADHLNRRTQTERVHAALEAANQAGIFACYNLLLFEPDATIRDVEDNVRFIRAHATNPVNFCRAEPYYGTPLHRDLEARGALTGSYLGFDYRIADDRTELLFRICSVAFRERNFAPHGVGNRHMGLGYAAKLLEFFHDDPRRERAALIRRATELTRSIALETAGLLEEAIVIARDGELSDRERMERETATLGLRVAALDAVRHVQIDRLQRDLRAFVDSSALPRPKSSPPRKLLQAVSGMAFASALSAWAIGCGGSEDTTVDPVPSDTGIRETFVADPLPSDSGVDTRPDTSGVDSMVVDPPPPDTGVDARDDTSDAFETSVVDPPPPDTGLDADTLGLLVPRTRLIDQWRDTTPKRSLRSDDLPLCEPPTIALRATRDGDRLLVNIVGGPAAIGTRWQADGAIAGDGRSVVWTPSSPEDRLRVAVRTKGGVAVVSCGADDA